MNQKEDNAYKYTISSRLFEVATVIGMYICNMYANPKGVRSILSIYKIE